MWKTAKGNPSPEYAEQAVGHLRDFTARDRTLILDTVARQLTHEPTVPTRNRKLLRANAIAPWELRIGSVRVYFEVQDMLAIVTIRAIGMKVRDRVLIGSVEVDLT
jgi:mRNA-degrading endonuclease RelE of RelBE toxin-antitoxin system